MSNQLSRQQRRKAEREAAKQAQKSVAIIPRHGVVVTNDRDNRTLTRVDPNALARATFEKRNTAIAAAMYSYETAVKVTAIFLAGPELQILLRGLITPYETAVSALEDAIKQGGEPVDPNTGRPIPGHMVLTRKWLELAQRVAADNATDQDIAALHQFALDTLPDMAEAYRQAQARQAAEIKESIADMQQQLDQKKREVERLEQGIAAAQEAERLKHRPVPTMEKAQRKKGLVKWTILKAQERPVYKDDNTGAARHVWNEMDLRGKDNLTSDEQVVFVYLSEDETCKEPSHRLINRVSDAMNPDVEPIALQKTTIPL